MPDYSRQHFVPQFYLKHFSSSENSIFCYDKVKDRSFTTNIANIAQENSFYAIPEIERSAIEKALGRIEQIYFRNPYFELIRLKNFARFPHKLRKYFFIFLAVQLVRTNETRLQMKQMHEQLLIALAKDYGIDIPKGIKVNINKDYAKAEHLLFLSDTDIFFELAKSLFNKKWVVCINKTKVPLWASDNPVSFHNDFTYEGNLGIWCPGVEIRFPLTHNLLLFSYDPERHIPVKNKDRLLQTLVEQANELQIKSSTRFIYSPQDDFEIARVYLNKYPEYRKPDRSRWKVMSDRHKIEFVGI